MKRSSIIAAIGASLAAMAACGPAPQPTPSATPAHATIRASISASADSWRSASGTLRSGAYALTLNTVLTWQKESITVGSTTNVALRAKEYPQAIVIVGTVSDAQLAQYASGADKYNAIAASELNAGAVATLTPIDQYQWVDSSGPNAEAVNAHIRSTDCVAASTYQDAANKVQGVLTVVQAGCHRGHAGELMLDVFSSRDDRCRVDQLVADIIMHGVTTTP